MGYIFIESLHVTSVVYGEDPQIPTQGTPSISSIGQKDPHTIPSLRDIRNLFLLDSSVPNYTPGLPSPTSTDPRFHSEIGTRLLLGGLPKSWCLSRGLSLRNTKEHRGDPKTTPVDVYWESVDLWKERGQLSVPRHKDGRTFQQSQNKGNS